VWLYDHSYSSIYVLTTLFQKYFPGKSWFSCYTCFGKELSFRSTQLKKGHIETFLIANLLDGIKKTKSTEHNQPTQKRLS